MPRPFRRRVLYIPGYDPIPPRRYRELYRREGSDQAAISGYALSFGPRKDRSGFGWAAKGDFDGAQTETEFEVLIWADIVQRSMGQSISATYGQMLRTAWAYIGSGALFSLMKLRRGPVIAALYPIIVLLLQLLLALAVSAGIGALVAHLTGLGWLLALPLTFGGTWAGLRLWKRLDGRIFAYYLMHDYAFTAQDLGAYPPALDQRITAFAQRIRAVLDQDLDEVLVVGHSSGAYLAVSVLAEMLEKAPPAAKGPKLSLLTLGHVVPMAAFLPKAQRLRRDLAAVSACPDLTWVDVSAPGDACSFGLCDPVAVTGVEPENRSGPLVLSAAFTQSLSPEKRRSLRGRWFRLHFQYLCAFDQPKDYDYFAITAGPVPLGARFEGQKHSPGRLSKPVNRWAAT